MRTANLSSLFQSAALLLLANELAWIRGFRGFRGFREREANRSIGRAARATGEREGSTEKFITRLIDYRQRDSENYYA